MTMKIRFEDVKTWFLVQLFLSFAFIVSGLIINFLQLLLFVFVRPFNVILFRKLGYYLSYSFYSNMTSLAQWWSGTRMKIYARPQDAEMFGRENSFIVMNHKYDVDWLLAGVFIQLINIMGGIKVVAKSEVKFMPIVGWLFYFAEYIFVERDWKSDHNSMTQDLNNVLNFPKGYHVSIGSFCEGTRFTREKHSESMRFARERGLPELKHHLLPRTKGFYLIGNMVKGKINYLYDCTLVIDDVDGHPPGFRDLINGRPLDAQLFVRRICLNDIPFDDETKCNQFLYKMYEEKISIKDQIFDVYHRTRDFGNIKGAKQIDIKPNRYDLYNSLAWICVVLAASLYFLFKFIWNGSWTLKFALTFGMFLINVLMKYIIGKTDIKTASKHGLGPGVGSTSQRVK